MCCFDVHKAKAYLLLENSIDDWLASHILPYNSKTLADVILCAERIGGSGGSMVPNGNRRFTYCINQS